MPPDCTHADAGEAAARALLDWLDDYEAETEALPLGAGSPVAWQSSFNARIAMVRSARAALARYHHCPDCGRWREGE